jgi:hypothetical protein
MAEERNPAEPEDRVEDLDVSEEESEDVKGGLNFSKIEFSSQKVQPIDSYQIGGIDSFQKF